MRSTEKLWLEKVLNDASSEVESWPEWLKDKERRLRRVPPQVLRARLLSSVALLSNSVPNWATKDGRASADNSTLRPRRGRQDYSRGSSSHLIEVDTVKRRAPRPDGKEHHHALPPIQSGRASALAVRYGPLRCNVDSVSGEIECVYLSIFCLGCFWH